MNIFGISYDTRECAEALDDKRLRKMLLETGQIISSAVHLINKEFGKDYLPYEGSLYKPTHLHHPVIKWAVKSPVNLKWLCGLFDNMCIEYRHRFNKTHLTQVKLSETIHDLAHNLSVRYYGQTMDPFVNCAGNEKLGISFKGFEPVTEAYKNYLCHRWDADKFEPIWTNRNQPEWYNGYR